MMPVIGVFALGSDHGDDRAGWDAVRLATPRLPLGAFIVLGSDPLAIIDGCPCDALVVADACRGAGPPGSVHRFEWPTPALARIGAVSSHGIGIPAVLELASVLGRLPPHVVVLAIEAEAELLGDGLSPAVLDGVPILAEIVVAEVTRLAGGSDERTDARS